MENAQKKLEDLTPEQEIELEEFYMQSLRTGLDTSPGDHALVEKTIAKIYDLEGLKKPKFFWVDSPDQAEDFINKNNKTKKYNGTGLWGQQDNYWVALYLFGLKLLPDIYEDADKEELLLMKTLCENCGWWYPYTEVCICVEKCGKGVLKGDNLHCDGGPSFGWKDGTGKMWFLNNVEVSQEIAETPAEKLDCALVLKTDNAEMRRELLRKIGVEKYLKEVKSEKIDTFIYQAIHEGEKKDFVYELFKIPIGKDRYAYGLKFENASIPGIYHIEMVGPEVLKASAQNGELCKRALNFRRGVSLDTPFEGPSQLS